MKRSKAVVALAAGLTIVVTSMVGCKHRGDHKGPHGSASARAAWADGGHAHHRSDGGRRGK